MNYKSSLLRTLNIFVIGLSIVVIEGCRNDSSTLRYNASIFDELIVEKDVKYGRSTSQGGMTEDLLMDIYYPKDDEVSNRPLIIFAHGGYFLFGDKEGFKEDCEYLAKSGYVVASINYRLIDVDETDQVSKRAVVNAVHDQKAVVRFFNKDFETSNVYRIDPNQIFIGGYSAGAVASLHYAYANTVQDVIDMGGVELLNYVIDEGGFEGNSGNNGYSSKIKGVVNFAGSVHSADLVDKDEPILISVHGDKDNIVPFFSGTTGDTGVITEGSGLIHKKANEIGLVNELITVEGLGHEARYYCNSCLKKIRQFIFDNL